MTRTTNESKRLSTPITTWGEQMTDAPGYQIESTKPQMPRMNAVWEIYVDGATWKSNPSSVGGVGVAVFADDRLWFASHRQLVGDVSNSGGIGVNVGS